MTEFAQNLRMTPTRFPVFQVDRCQYVSTSRADASVRPGGDVRRASERALVAANVGELNPEASMLNAAELNGDGDAQTRQPQRRGSVGASDVSVERQTARVSVTSAGAREKASVCGSATWRAASEGALERTLTPRLRCCRAPDSLHPRKRARVCFVGVVSSQPSAPPPLVAL